MQGDEPLFNPKDLKKLIYYAKKNMSKIVNGYCPVLSKNDYLDVNIPKVVFDKNGYLMYMTRASIPSNKKNIFKFAWRQVCAYSLPYKVLDFFYKNKKKNNLRIARRL